MLLRRLEREAWPHRCIDLSRSAEAWAQGQSRWARLATLGGGLRRMIAEGRSLEREGKVLYYIQGGQGVASMSRDLCFIHAAARSGCPVVLHIHGGGLRKSYEGAPPLLQRLFRGAWKRLSKVVVLSPGLKREFSGLFPPEKIEVVANGVPQALFDSGFPSPRGTPAAGEKWQVLYLSNLIEDKGYVDVLRAAKCCQEQALPVHFTLAGAQTDRSHVDPVQWKRDHGLENLDVVGPLYGEEKKQAFARSHLFLLPSRMTEGQPISILEAMHFGVLVLSTRRGGIPELMAAQEGLSPLEMEEDFPTVIATKLRALCEGEIDFEKNSQRNQREAQTHYTEEQHTDRLLSLFESLSHDLRNGDGVR